MKLVRPRNQCKQKLICYEIEIAKHKHFYSSLIDIEEAEKIIRLLSKYFKIGVKQIDFNYKSKLYGGKAERKTNKIRFRRKKLNLLIVCHELCHLLCYKKEIFGHPKEFYDNLDRIVDFIENNIRFSIQIKRIGQ